MSEPVYTHTPTGQQDIAELERHQQRLLYGGGAVLSLLILLVLLAWILLSINDYKSDQLDDFRKAKLALDSAFIQRDTGYIRTLNMIEYVWRNRSAELVAKGQADYQSFAAHDDQAVVQASHEAMPWLVLGSALNAWPQDKVERYLGLVHELSVISGISITERAKEPGTLGYFYDPSEALFAFGSGLNGPQLHAAAEQTDRAALFSKLKAPNIDFDNLQALRDLRQGNPTLPFYGVGMPQVLSSYGKNPSNGQPSIIGSLVAMDGDTPIGAIVIYEPLERFISQLRKAAQNDFTVIAEDGQVVLSTRPPADSREVAVAFKPWLGIRRAENTAVRYRSNGRFFIAERVSGTQWTLVRSYTWMDILRNESLSMLTACIIAVVLLIALWMLLIRQDRSVFAPALARAKRVYQSELLNRTMIETSPVGLCVIAKDSAAPLLQNDLVRGYAVKIPDPDTTFYRQLLQDYAEAEHPLDGRPEAREFGYTLASGNGEGRRHLLVAALPIIYQDQQALFCVLRDVTARTELEENLRRARQDSESARQAAESASRAKSSFVAMMSHEIRTPLNGILGHLELLSRSQLEPSQHERLDRIRLSADTLLAIISDVLDFSRIEAGQLDIDPIRFELRPLMEQTALLYAPVAQRKGLRLYYGVEAGLAPAYVADAHRIRQVLNNLVSNAVKFTESGRIVLRVRRAVEASGETMRLRFEIIDSGIGMTDEQCQQIFQPFSQADASISRRFGGSGLGLTLCQQISELMGGHIEVQSTPAVGSVFSFEVPVIEDVSAPPADLRPLAKRKIALLSAAAEWRTEVETLLSGWGAKVVVAAQPSELDLDGVANADALVIFGAWRAWSDDDEKALIDRAGRVVRATTDGPLLPELRDGSWYISCYSSAALQAAILEAHSDHVAERETVAQGPQKAHAVEQRARVLLVDDNPVNRELIQQQLETLGYVVDAAEDGTVALRLWQDGRYGVVLTDINMPHMNGYELTQELRQRGASVPILAITATALASEKARCKDAGIDDLLLKPLSLERLEEALTRHLASVAQPVLAPVKPAWAAKFPEKVCRVFVESGTRDLQAILDAAHVNDEETMLARLHSLKGALLMLGEQDIAAQSATMEKVVDASGIDAASGMLRDFEVQMRMLLQRYSEVN
ncbi:response regulator [Dyella psychrodurans]|nr:response regulator [Dyella psychrodurans]